MLTTLVRVSNTKAADEPKRASPEWAARPSGLPERFGRAFLSAFQQGTVAQARRRREANSTNKDNHDRGTAADRFRPLY
jgi:hypothetical protein